MYALELTASLWADQFSVLDKDTKVTMTIFDVDGIVVNSVGEVKQRRFCTES